MRTSAVAAALPLLDEPDRLSRQGQTNRKPTLTTLSIGDPTDAYLKFGAFHAIMILRPSRKHCWTSPEGRLGGWHGCVNGWSGNNG